jgi:hypothetical protein
MHLEEEHENTIEFGVSYLGVTKYIFPPPAEVTGDNHEPPIGIEEGSCYFSFPINEVDIRPLVDEAGLFYYGTQYNRYKFRGPAGIEKEYLGISQVRVLTERSDTGLPDYAVYMVSQSDKANINLWLHGTSLTDPPDIIVQGFANGSILTRKLLHFQVLTGLRKRYYNKLNPTQSAPGDSDNREIRLIKWQIVRGDRPAEVLVQDAGADMFTLHVFFHHPAPPPNP